MDSKILSCPRYTSEHRWWRWFFPLTITYPYEFKYLLSSSVDESIELPK